MPQFWTLFKPYAMAVVADFPSSHEDSTTKARSLVKDGKALVMWINETQRSFASYF